MIKKIISLLFLMLIMTANASYQAGDVVQDFSFQDSNLNAEGNVVIYDRTIHGLIDEGKTILIFFAKCQS